MKRPQKIVKSFRMELRFTLPFQAEGDYPLSEIGMIHWGLPQLMLIDVEGREMRNEKTMSLYNEKELKVLVRSVGDRLWYRRVR